MASCIVCSNLLIFNLGSDSADTIRDGSVAICTPHTGFSDPNTPDGAPLRQSIELRALVFYN